MRKKQSSIGIVSLHFGHKGMNDSTHIHLIKAIIILNFGAIANPIFRISASKCAISWIWIFEWLTFLVFSMLCVSFCPTKVVSLISLFRSQFPWRSHIKYSVWNLQTKLKPTNKSVYFFELVVVGFFFALWQFCPQRTNGRVLFWAKPVLHAKIT